MFKITTPVFCFTIAAAMFANVAGTANAQKVSVKANEVLLFMSMANNKLSSYIVTKSEIANLGDWSGDGNPPLSQKKATSLAIAKFEAQHGKGKLNKISLKNKKVHYLRGEKGPETVWYYKVKVKGTKRMSYVVLMDERFVEPVVADMED